MLAYVKFIKYQSKYLNKYFKIYSDPIRTDRFKYDHYYKVRHGAIFFNEQFFWREKVFELVRK